MSCFLHVRRRVLQSQQTPSILGLAGTHVHCDNWLLLTLVVWFVDACEVHMTRPSPRTVDAGGSPGCQSVFHCRVSPMHMPHRALKLNVYAATSAATDRVVRLVFLEGRSLSNPVEARCCIAPKDCMQK